MYRVRSHPPPRRTRIATPAPAALDVLCAEIVSETKPRKRECEGTWNGHRKKCHSSKPGVEMPDNRVSTAVKQPSQTRKLPANAPVTEFADKRPAAERRRADHDKVDERATAPGRVCRHRW